MVRLRCLTTVWRHNADKHRRDVEFTVGDMVYLKLRPYRQQSVARRVCQKLSAKYFGPYEVLERIGKAAYRLALPPETKIHHVFHVSQLKAVLGAEHQVLPLPVLPSGLDDLVILSEAILDTLYNDKGALELLVQWCSLPSSENTWVLYGELRDHPTFKLEDKLNFEKRGIDKLQYRCVRRKKKVDVGGKRENGESGSLKEDS